MAKVIKGVVSVIGAVASVLAVIPSPIQPIAAVVATAAAVASTALNIIAPNKPPSAQGQQTSFKLDPQAGIPYAIGRTLSGGWSVHRDTWGADNSNNGFAIVWSGGGPVQAIEAFQADQTTIAFDGAGNALGSFRDFMYLTTQLGSCPSPALASPVAGFPGWGATSKLSGYAAGVWVTTFDKKGKKYASGLPKPAAILQGVKVYDPRLDSTYPGGAGACRALNEATYVYSENPWLHALTWALGRWQNGVKVLGVGMKVEQISVASFVDAANIADANGWKAGGIVSSVDDKWDVLKMLAQAGGGQCFRLGAKLTAFVEAPRVAVATIRESDIVGKAQISATQFQRSRINRVVPIFRSEAHGWEQVPADPILYPAFEAEDGGRRTAETEFVLVQQIVQAGQLGAYEVLNSREFGPIDLELKIEWLGIEPGDLVVLDMPNIGLANQPALALTRGLDPGTGNVALSLRSETASKHADALARSTTVAASPSLVPPDLSIVAAPAVGVWTGAAGLVEGPGGTGLPVLVARGAADNPNASHIVFEYRPIVAPVGAMPGAPVLGQIAVDSTGAEFVYEATGWARRWFMQSTQDAGVTVQEFSAVTPQTSYQIAVSYVSRGVLGARRIIGPLVTGQLIASNFAGAGALATASYVRFGDGTIRSNGGGTATDAGYLTALGISAGITGQGPSATDTRGLDALYDSRANLLFNGGFSLVGYGWSLGPWNTTAGGNEGAYAWSSLAGTNVAVAREFGCYQGVIYTLAADLYSGGLAAGSLNVDVEWYNSAGAIIGYSNRITRSAAADWSRARVAFSSPAGAAKAKVRIFTVDATIISGQAVAVRRIKICGGDVDVPFTDEATNSALYDGNVPIEVLRPAEANANVTETRVASGFLGQTSWATWGDFLPVTIGNRTSRLIDDGTYDDVGSIRNRRLTRLRRDDGITDLTEGMAITSLGTAAGIAGQAWAATNGSQAAVDNNYVQTGMNACVNSDFTASMVGWEFGGTGVAGAIVSGGRNMTGYSGKRNVLWSRVWFTEGGNVPANQWFFGPIQGGSWNGEAAKIKRYGIPVKQGDKLFARGLFAIHGGTTVALRVRFWNESGVIIYEQDIVSVIGDARLGAPTGAGGDPANFTEIQGFWSAPAGAAFATWNCFGYTGSAAVPDAYLFITEPLLARIPANQVAGVPYMPGPSDRASDTTSENTAAAFFGQTSWATLGWSTNRISQLTDAGRAVDGRLLNSSNNYGLRALSETPTFSQSNAGSSVTLDLGSNGKLYSDWGATITLPSATFTGLAYSSTYYVWRNMPSPDGAGSSYGYSSTLTDALGIGKVYLGYVTTMSSGGTGGGGGGYGGGGECVALSSDIALVDGSSVSAAAVLPGASIAALAVGMDGTSSAVVDRVRVAENECVRLVSASGAKLSLALNTPMTLPGGRCEIAANMTGLPVAVLDDQGFRWEPVVAVEYLGRLPVAEVTCGNATYAAGDLAGRFIFSHNIWNKP